MKQFIILVLLLVFSIVYAQRIAVVDVEKVMKADQQLRIDQKTIKATFSPRLKVLAKERVALKKLLKQQMSEKDNKAVAEQVTELEQKIHDDAARLQLDVQNAQAKSLRRAYSRARTTISNIAKSKDYDVVLIKGQSIYAKADTDITQSVIRGVKQAK